MEGVQCRGQRNDRDETGKVRTTINLAAKPPVCTIVHSRRALNLLFCHFSFQTLIPVCDGDRERPEPPS